MIMKVKKNIQLLKNTPITEKLRRPLPELKAGVARIKEEYSIVENQNIKGETKAKVAREKTISNSRTCIFLNC